MNNLIYSIKRLYVSKPWIMYVAIALIVLGSALNIFFDFLLVFEILDAIVISISFVCLIFFLIAGDEKTGDLVETMSLFKIQVRTRTDKTVDNIMIITYSAVVVFGTFVDSVLVICIGIAMFIINCAASLIARIYYTNKYR